MYTMHDNRSSSGRAPRDNISARVWEEEEEWVVHGNDKT